MRSVLVLVLLASPASADPELSLEDRVFRRSRKIEINRGELWG